MGYDVWGDYNDGNVPKQMRVLSVESRDDAVSHATTLMSIFPESKFWVKDQHGHIFPSYGE